MPVIKFEGLNAKYSKLKGRAEELAKELSSIEIEMNECLTEEREKNLLLLFGRELPKEIINLIFEFDPTKREAFNRCMNQFSKGCYDRRVKAKQYVASRFDRCGHEDLDNEEERMAAWVDNLYKRQYSTGEEVHMDGRYIKPTMPTHVLPVVANSEELNRGQWAVGEGRRREEFKIAPGDDRWTINVYMYTYRANQRDWRGKMSVGRQERRVEKGLPIYADKARYNMYICSRYCTYKNIKFVSKILKNIKKWGEFNPELCDY